MSTGFILSEAEFQAQKDFILDIASITSIDLDVELAAVQYGVGSKEIIPLTSDIDSFRNALSRREKSMNSSRTSISAGIRYCSSQLRPSQRDADKIVILRDGNWSASSSPVQPPRRFRNSGGEVCEIGL